MTYCLGIKVADGLVFAADSRTNAGIDSVSTFRKLFAFEEVGSRVLVVLTAGNLSVTQEVISMIDRELGSEDPTRSILKAESVFDATRIIGGFVRAVFDRDGAYLRAHEAEFNPSFIVGGQISGKPPALFLVYPAGNFIEAKGDTQYFQLGETKYGKPILERVLTKNVGLLEAAKCTLVSFDSTIRANLSVGLPIDLVIIQRDDLRVGIQKRIKDKDPYYETLTTHWSEGLRRVYAEAPNPPWESEPPATTADAPFAFIDQA